MRRLEDILNDGLEGVEIISPQRAALMAEQGAALLIDIRDPRERQRDGCIKGAYPMPRGMLEFWMHPDSPYYRSVFGKYDRFVFICARDWRARLAAKAARDLGYEALVMAGGQSGWREAGLPLVCENGEKFYTLAEIEARLPHILKRANIARLEDGRVLIGNRRDYPFKKDFVACDSVEDVAKAIKDMVTQGVGPWVAAAHALALRAQQCAGREDIMEELQAARERLVRTRPTNTLIRQRLAALLETARKAQACGEDVSAAILAHIGRILDQMYKYYGLRAHYGASLIADGDGILTMCFAETSFVLAMAFARDAGKDIRVYVPETRPYLQGARLTAPSLHEIGIDVRLITDNMPAAMMASGKIDKYMTAADLITLDGHVVNKVGTFQNAIAAHAHDIPYFVFAWGMDASRPDKASIEIEERDEAEIRHCRGVATTLEDIRAEYPAFDITPPKYVAGVITRHGIKSPFDLKGGFEQ